MRTVLIYILGFISAYLFFELKNNKKSTQETITRRIINIDNLQKSNRSRIIVGREFVHSKVFTQYLRYYSKIYTNKWAKSLYNFELTNLEKTSKRLYLFCNMNKFSEPTMRVISLLPMQKDTVGITPKIDYAQLASLKENDLATMNIYLLNSNMDTIFKKSEEIEFYSNNVAVFALKTIYGKIDLRDYLAIWVTPNITEFNEILRDAVEFTPSKSFYGYQEVDGLSKQVSINVQVKAIYQVLKNLDIAYVNSPITYVGSQQIKSPKEVLFYRSANCIEGVLLFASLLETIGIESLIVLIDGHSFLGWKIHPNTSDVDFLETTYIWSVEDYSFEQAHKVAREEFENNRGNLKIIDIAKLRKRDIYPGYF